MYANENDHKMIFDFANTNDNERILFEKPKKIVIAYTHNEVLKVMDEIDQLINEGYYAAGYMSYEASKALNDEMVVNDQYKMPLVYFGIFEEPVRISRHNNHDDSDDIKLNWEINVKEKEYLENIDSIKKFIADGDTYQVNYTMRLSADYSFDDVKYYEQLLKAQNSNYSAYLNLGRFKVLSVSPELFFEVENDKITTKPMKGTIKRGRWFEEDISNRDELMNSEKDKAENLMIVDLLRNDLSKIAKTGTVKVPKLFEVEKYPTVYQLTSTITAELAENITFSEIFKALFPCGSITGAPKVSTMAIINELEDTPREVYCGSIGYITPERKAVFNVAIRTVVIDTHVDKAYYGIGGGITWESTSHGEYKEALAKSKVLHEDVPQFELMETIRHENNELYLLENHLSRISKSAQYFNIPFKYNEVKQRLINFSNEITSSKITKVNLFVDLQGNYRFKAKELKENFNYKKAILASSPIYKNNKFLYHKTTHREMYEKYKKTTEDKLEILLWNEDRELTEFTIGNLVVKWKGEYWTPPIRCGLLPGTFREHLISEGKIKERTLLMENLSDYEEIWLVNSLRGWVKVNLQQS